MNSILCTLLITFSLAAVVYAQSEQIDRSSDDALVHTVYFWFLDEVSDEEHANFYEELKKLKAIEQIRYGWVGVPAATEERGVIDSTYDYSITFVFDDEAAEHEYQVHPLHVEFIENNSHLWANVVVYDAVTPK